MALERHGRGIPSWTGTRREATSDPLRVSVTGGAERQFGDVAERFHEAYPSATDDEARRAYRPSGRIPAPASASHCAPFTN